ncbi:MAG: hypothetical protein E7428_01235 [Ruminococcaceae bacterium]|nr:hypothetical protein [Oscillospiraceae bacterium]
MQTLVNRKLYSLEESRKNASYVMVLIVYLVGYGIAAVFTPLYALQNAVPGAFLWEETMGAMLLRLLFPLSLMFFFALHPAGTVLIPCFYLLKGFADGCIITSIMKNRGSEELYRIFLSIGPELLYSFLVVAWCGACAHYNAIRLYRGEAGIHLRNFHLLIRVTSAKVMLGIVASIVILLCCRFWLIPLLFT